MPPWAALILGRLQTYAEVSPSGTGVKAYAICKEQLDSRKLTGVDTERAGKTPAIEFYSSARFFAVTGETYGDQKPVRDCTNELVALHHDLFPIVEPAKSTPGGPTTSPAMADEEVLGKCRAARNSEKFTALYDRGEWEAPKYPSQSEADAALAMMLGFYSQDSEQLERLFDKSALGKREKWTEREDYRVRTIERALSSLTETYSSNPLEQQSRFESKTEGCLAKLLAVKLRNQIFYSGEAWHQWDGRCWRLAKDFEILGLVMEVIHGLIREAVEQLRPDSGQDELRWIQRFHKAQMGNNLMELMKSELFHSDYDRQPHLVNFLNGTIDTTTMLLREHRPADFLTQLARVEYDWTALAPKWDGFLQRCWPDGTIRRTMQTYFGSAIARLIEDEHVLILCGNGANGKSTLVSTLRGVLSGQNSNGGYAKQAAFNTFSNTSKEPSTARGDILRLRNARLVIASESDNLTTLSGSTVKSLTGAENVVVRGLYKAEEEFRPAFRVVLSTNHLPRVTDSSEGMWRRLVLVPCVVIIPEAERDYGLQAKLLAEAQGIIAWLIDGLVDYKLHGLALPGPVREATAAYRDAENIVKQFINDYCQVQEGGQTNSGELYRAFQSAVEENGWARLSQTAFGKALGKLGFASDKRKIGGRTCCVRLGLTLNNHGGIDDEPF